MIYRFYRVKLKASGFPSWAATDAQKQEYVTWVNEEFHADYKAVDFVYNPGLRLVAKIALNSIWVCCRDDVNGVEFLMQTCAFKGTIRTKGEHYKG